MKQSRMIRMINNRRPGRGKVAERGIQLLELALVTPIMFTLIAAAFEFGNYMYTYLTLTKSTRLAARYLTNKPFDNTEKATAKNLALCGSPNSCGSGSEVARGLTLSNIQITSTGANTLTPDTVTVQIINYNYQSFINLNQLVGGADWSNISINPSTTMRYMPWY